MGFLDRVVVFFDITMVFFLVYASYFAFKRLRRKNVIGEKYDPEDQNSNPDGRISSGPVDRIESG